MKRSYYIGAGALLFAAACADVGPSEPQYAMDPLAREYVSQALDIMQDNSVRKHEIEWPAFRDATYYDAEGARNPSETYSAIIGALSRLGDNHSFFTPPGESVPIDGPRTAPQSITRSNGSETDINDVEELDVRLLESGFGYVRVGPFSGGAVQAAELVAQYHRLIEDVDASGSVCGWVVDVRGNTGGNMWPMVAGVSPLLGEGTVGYFVDADRRVSGWFNEQGRVGIDDLVLAEAPLHAELEHPLAPVAVLTDERTASAGEAVAIALRGRPASRAFGAPTWGVSTANSAFPLSDGAVLVLTVATMADRLGNVYGGPVQPDQIVSSPSDDGSKGRDAVLLAATEWLLQRPCT